MPDVLSQQEIDALLAMTSEDVSEAALPPGKRLADKARSYNFKGQRKITEDARKTLEGIHRSFATLLTGTFSTMQKTIVEVAPPHITDEMPYSDFVVTLLNPSCSYTFEMKIEDSEPVRCVIDFSPSLAFCFVDRMFGGKGESTLQNRPLTPIERPMMLEVAARALEDLAASWVQILDISVDVNPTDISFQPNPDFLQVSSHEEIVVYVAFEVSSASLGSMLINLCYPFTLLEPIIDLLNPQRALSTRKKTVPAGPRIEKYLARVPSEVRVVLGSARITIRDLLGLREGDVVTLETRVNEPSVLFVGDRPKYLTRPGKVGKSLAVEVLRSVETDEEERFVAEY